MSPTKSEMGEQSRFRATQLFKQIATDNAQKIIPTDPSSNAIICQFTMNHDEFRCGGEAGLIFSYLVLHQNDTPHIEHPKHGQRIEVLKIEPTRRRQEIKMILKELKISAFHFSYTKCSDTDTKITRGERKPQMNHTFG